MTSEWFDVFGAKPIEGRVFAAEKDKPGVAHVAVLAHATWVQLFGSDPKVIGRTVELSQQFYKIIGVMDASFEWPKQVALWVPLVLPPEAFAPKQREGGTLHVMARMQPEVRFQQASSWVDALTERAANQGTPDSLLLKNLGWTMVARSFIEESTGGTQKALLVLFASVGLVLLIACLNIAGLLLARSSSRAHELAMRAALGADRLRIIRQMLSESLILAVSGALLGLHLAQGFTTLLLKLAPEELSIGLQAFPDGHVMVFTLSVTVLSGFIFGILPAVQMSKPESVKAGSTRASTGGLSGQRQRSALVILETALSVVLLVGAGLLLRTLNVLGKG